MLGDGILQPRGLMTVATAYTGDNVRAWGTVQKFKTGVNGAFAATPNGGDVFIDAAMSLRGAYRANSVWGMNRFTLAAAMKLKDSDGNYIWQPSWNLTDAPFGTICGIRVALTLITWLILQPIVYLFLWVICVKLIKLLTVAAFLLCVTISLHRHLLSGI